MTIHLKLSLVLAVGMAASCLASALVFVEFRRGSSLAREKEKWERIAQDVARAGAEAQLGGDMLMLSDYLEALRRDAPELASCRLRVGADWRDVGGAPAAAAHEQRVVEVPARGESPALAVELGFSRRRHDESERRELASLARDLGRAVAAVLALGLCLAGLFGWTMTRRIVRIEQALQRIGDGGEPALSAQGSDEIGRLARGVNAMSERLKAAEAAKATFVASVTHELRSPLAAIESHVRAVLARPNQAASRENLERVLRSAGQLGHFVSNLLELSKIDRGKLEFYPRRCDLRAVVQDAAAFLGPRAQEAGLTIAAELQELAPLELDPDLISQVMTNLISNAIKFTPRGGSIRIELGASEEGGRPGARCRVSDTGVGIPAGALQRIFAPFERVPNPLRATGAGLGLSICKAIIDLHAGALAVESAPGKGSRFSFFLPEAPPSRRAGAGPGAAAAVTRNT